jgi:hypothetical protein
MRSVLRPNWRNIAIALIDLGAGTIVTFILRCPIDKLQMPVRCSFEARRATRGHH